jgi:hypothetical protein
MIYTIILSDFHFLTYFIFIINSVGGKAVIFNVSPKFFLKIKLKKVLKKKMGATPFFTALPPDCRF